jgi:hypothetical protein
MKYDRYYMLREYRITQIALGYSPQHNTEHGWQAIKEPQQTIQQARDIIELHRHSAGDADTMYCTRIDIISNSTTAADGSTS